MYNKDKTLLIYHSKVMKDFMTTFGINNKVITNNLKNGSFYLGKYVFSSVPILTAKKANYCEEEIQTVLAEDRRRLSLFMYNKDKSVLLYSGAKTDYTKIGIYTQSENVSKCIDTDLLYLDKYGLTTI